MTPATNTNAPAATMSPAASSGAPLNKTLEGITAQLAVYMPAAMAAAQGIEAAAPAASDDEKLQHAVNIVQAVTAAASGIPNPNVQGIAALVNVAVMILNATGVFHHHKKPAAPKAA